MTEAEDPSRDRLKHHFAQRVIHQARQILEVWQRLQQSEWSASDMAELSEANQRLLRFAERFEQFEHAQLATAIGQSLADVEANRGRLSSVLITDLNRLMQRLSRTGLRHGDRLDQTSLPPLRKPIYIVLQDHERGERLAKQLEFFGLSAQSLDSVNAFHATLAERLPAAVVMDVDFGGVGEGLKLASKMQEGLEQKLPLLFFSHHETDTPTRLAAVRAGGEEFLTGTLEASSLLEKIEILTRVAQYEPYKVLVIDDSRAQATHTERLLNSAGIVTRTLFDPIQTMAELADFQPDLIILDMYMPGCTGTELAKVIRHNDRYVSVPIIYLSAEDDLDKQLDAMSEGGDDFLTKPIDDLQLLSRVRALSKFKLVADELRKREANGRRMGVIDMPATVHSGHSAKVLVIDDNERQAARICNYLQGEHQPITLQQAGGLGAGVATVDLMVVSLSGTNFDGLKLIAHLRTLESTRDLPVLAIVDPHDDAKAIQALDLGASDILIKPLDSEELLARVKTQAKKKRYIDALRMRLDQSMEMAITDQLTGLYNRRYMKKQLDQFVSRANRGGGAVSVVLCDLDRFKRVNDIYGHDVGDEVLKEFGRRIQANLRPGDIACRYGGEEFVVIMPNTTLAMAYSIGDRLREVVEEEPFIVNKGFESLDVTMSGGVATSTPPDEDVMDLIKRADEALYSAKNAGRNRIESATQNVF